jgi:hypothetical protein
MKVTSTSESAVAGLQYVASAPTTQKTSLPTAPVLLRVDSLLRKRVYSPFSTNDRIENIASYIVASVSDAVDMCLSCRCLAMTTSASSTISTFRFHVPLHLMATQNDVEYGLWQHLLLTFL